MEFNVGRRPPSAPSFEDEENSASNKIDASQVIGSDRLKRAIERNRQKQMERERWQEKSQTGLLSTPSSNSSRNSSGLNYFQREAQRESTRPNPLAEDERPRTSSTSSGNPGFGSSFSERFSSTETAKSGDFSSSNPLSRARSLRRPSVETDPAPAAKSFFSKSYFDKKSTEEDEGEVPVSTPASTPKFNVYRNETETKTIRPPKLLANIFRQDDATAVTSEGRAMPGVPWWEKLGVLEWAWIKKVQEKIPPKEDMRMWAMKGAWIFFVFLGLKLIFSERGVMEFYSLRNVLDAKYVALGKIESENNKLLREIDKIKNDTNYQKYLLRENLGHMAADEFLVLFPEDK